MSDTLSPSSQKPESTTQNAELRDFVAAALPLLGALVEPEPDGTVTAVLSPELAGALAVAEAVELVFDPQRAPQAGAAAGNGSPGDGPLVVTVGSPFLEALLTRAAGIGLTTRWYVSGPQGPQRTGIAIDVGQWGARVVDARLSRPESMETPFACHYLACAVLVSLVSDERHESLHTIVVDTRTGQAAPLDWTRWERLRLDPQPHFAVAGRDVLPSAEQLQAAWARATALLERALQPTLAAYTRQAARRLELEQARVRSYFDESEAELRRRLTRAQSAAGDSGASDHGPRARSLEQKLQATIQERERKLADLQEKHRVRVTLTLVNAALITQPKLSTRVHIENRYAAVDWPLTLDPVTGGLELPICSHCGDAVDAVLVCAGGPRLLTLDPRPPTSDPGAGGHLVCPRCAVACVACRRRYCPSCAAEAIRTCAVCSRPVCRHSLVGCRTCGAATCPEDQGRCHAREARGKRQEAGGGSTEELEGGEAGGQADGRRRAASAAEVPADTTITSGRKGRQGARQGLDADARRRSSRPQAPTVSPAPAAARPLPLASPGARLRLAGRLYRRLRQYALGADCRTAYQATLARTFGEQPPAPGTPQRIDFDEWFSLQGWNGRWILPQAFARDHPELAAEEVALLRSWTASVRREYRVVTATAETMKLDDVATGQRHTARAAHRQLLPYLAPGAVIATRLLSAGGDLWFFPDAVFYVGPV